MGPGACQILVIWGPCEPPMLVAPQAQAENLKTPGSRCAFILMKSYKEMSDYVAVKWLLYQTRLNHWISL